MSLKTKTRCHAAFIILIHRTVMACLCLLAAVQMAAQQEVVYEQVTNASQLVDGGKYIIVDVNKDMALGWDAGNNRRGVGISGERTGSIIKGITIAREGTDHESVYEFSLYSYPYSKKEQWGLFDSVHRKFLYPSNSKNNDDNYIGLLQDKEGTVPEAASAAISFKKSGNRTVSSIVFHANGLNTTRLQLNTYFLSSTCYFSCYSKNEVSTIALYRKRVGTISISKFGYATYKNDFRYRMPQGCTGFLVSVADTGGTSDLLLTERYREGDIVPEKTPLLIQGEEGDYPVYQTARKSADTTGQDSANLLHADFDAEGNITYDIGNRESNYYYKLGTRGGENIGFYWGAEDGAPFRMKGTERAYLVLPRQRSQVRGLVLDEARTETAVTLPGHIRKPAGGLHDLSGRPCQGSPAPGIYVRDGRKVIVRR